MKSPKDMRIIQIDITNACIHQCSNCTRFCGHHKKPFFMEFETFQRAVDSLEGYIGTVGIMGGEPTLHPEFPKFVEYLGKKRSTKTKNHFIRPQSHFMDSIHDLELEYTKPYDSGAGVRQTLHGSGLWSAIGRGYKRYYEVIQDNIQYQALNDHSNPMYHQPALITRKELGIPDDQWVKLRDACWIQNLWSASVTPKGAFFCEIAGALDMLFDGPGGWPIESGWWKRTPAEFEDQLHWCELCGIACQTFTRNANEEIDDVSPFMYEKLKSIGSPRLKSNHVNVVDIVNGTITEESKAAGRRFKGSMPYTESYGARFNEKKTNLTEKELVGIFLLPEQFEPENVKDAGDKFNRIIISTPKPLEQTVNDRLSGKADIRFVADMSFGHLLYDVLGHAEVDTFAFVMEGTCRIHDNLFSDLLSWVLNPGTLLAYHGTGNGYFTGNSPFAAALINGRAASICRIGWDRILKMRTLDELCAAWMQEKIVTLEPGMAWNVPTSEIKAGKRYAVYGAGQGCLPVMERIRAHGSVPVLLVDADAGRPGKLFEGLAIRPVETLISSADDYDAVVISTSMYYQEVKERLLKAGIPLEKLVLP